MADTNSVSHKRKAESYLAPINHKMLLNYCDMYDITKSKVIDLAVKQFFDAMPKDIREKILAHKMEQ